MPVSSPPLVGRDEAVHFTWLPSPPTSGGEFDGYGSLAAWSTNDSAGPRARPMSRPNSWVQRLPAVPLRVPDGERVIQMRAHRVPIAHACHLAHAGVLDHQGSSGRWLAHLYRGAAGAVTAGRVVPRVVDGAAPLVRWEALAGESDEFVEAMSAAAPAVLLIECRDAQRATRALFDGFADAHARWRLEASGWTPPIALARSRTGRLLRSFAHAAISDDAALRPVRGSDDAFVDLVAQAEAVRAYAEDRPVLRWRIRLSLPGSEHDEAADNDDRADEEPSAAELSAAAPSADDLSDVGDSDASWPVTLELVDAHTPERWCTAHEVHARHERAHTLARAAAHLAHLDASLDALCAQLTQAGIPTPEGTTEARWDTAQVATALERTQELAARGVELLAPLSLTRRPVTTVGVVEPPNGPSRVGQKAIVSWSATIDDTPIDEEALRRAVEGLTIVRSGDEWVRISAAQARHALANLDERRANASHLGTIDALRLAAELDGEQPDSDLDDDAFDDEARTRLTGTGWLAEIFDGLADEQLRDGDVPPTFQATLRPYQRRGLGWMQFLRHHGLGGCLADDMGLGKTPTTLAHLAGIDGPHLVVCPLSVVRNWQTEAGRFAPLMRVLVHHGASRAGATRFSDEVASHDLVLTTYAIAARDVELLREQEWSTLVLDEAQAIKNPQTATARALRSVPAAQVIALTGTPVENRLSELWSIMATTNPGLLGSQRSFRTRYALPIERHHSKKAAAELRRLTAPFLLRRTKADRTLVPDLPDKVEQLAWASLTREQAVLYEHVVTELLIAADAAEGMRRRGLVLAALTKLKQICNHPAQALADGSALAGRSGKLARFDELVRDLLDTGERGLVFTQYRAMGELLQRHLVEQFDLRTPFLHGGVSKKGREAMIGDFQEGIGPSPLLIISLKAGGTGLNLTAASRVVHYDRWWNPAVEDQATDRAWRIGQQRAVLVHKLVCAGTVEERVDRLIDDKRALAATVVGTTGEKWLGELSTAELRDLVVLDRSALA